MKKNNLLSTLHDIRSLLASRKPVLTFEEACAYTGMSSSYMYKLTSSKLIPHSKPQGKMIYFDRQDLENWMLKNPIKTESQLETAAALHLTIKKRKQ